MICALKLPSNRDCIVDIPKAVFSYWPIFNDCLEYKTTISNISLTFRNYSSSPFNLLGVLLFFPDKHIHGQKIYPITETLLNPANPLSISYTGPYEQSLVPNVLSQYDGVDNVFVDCCSKLYYCRSESIPLDIVRVNFSKPITPGLCAAVRFVYFCSPSFFDVGRDQSLHFTQVFLDIKCMVKHIPENLLRTMEIPMLTVYDQEESGGFDIFYYMPLEIRGDDFEYKPYSRARPKHDFLGRPTPEPLTKYSWQAREVLRIAPNTPTQLHIGHDLVLSGVFCPRTLKRSIYMIDKIKLNNGNVLINSNVSKSDFSTTVIGPGVDQELIDRLLSVAKDLELFLAGETQVPDEKKALIRPYVDLIKTQATTKNRNLLRNTLSGLRETLRAAGEIAPSIAKIVETLKESF